MTKKKSSSFLLEEETDVFGDSDSFRTDFDLCFAGEKNKLFLIQRKSFEKLCQ